MTEGRYEIETRNLNIQDLSPIVHEALMRLHDALRFEPLRLRGLQVTYDIAPGEPFQQGSTVHMPILEALVEVPVMAPVEPEEPEGPEAQGVELGEPEVP